MKVDLAVTSDVKNGQDSRHICDICKKSFKRKAFLKKHMKVHLGNDKYYNCAFFLTILCILIYLTPYSGDHPLPPWG